MVFFFCSNASFGIRLQGLFFSGTRDPSREKCSRFRNTLNQGAIGCTSTSVPMVFIAFSRDSWG